jgi:hypothetical protein
LLTCRQSTFGGVEYLRKVRSSGIFHQQMLNLI